ncbi:MAG: hypothetical protein ABEN55_20785 [Bradymonadaceae bacterium]
MDITKQEAQKIIEQNNVAADHLKEYWQSKGESILPVTAPYTHAKQAIEKRNRLQEKAQKSEETHKDLKESKQQDKGWF